MRYLAPFISLIVALWVFYDSQKRGYTIGRGLLWAAGVSLALIVFFPLYLVSRKRKEKLFARERESQGPVPLTSCFYCGKEYAGEPKVCPHCGQNLRM
jgi:hypothetical protein